ncbi:MAG TPA: ABC transporter permease [Acidimicrobiales bacterium]|nr:ABC transporter permease [Acidimicrobiales bacterium]
MLRRLAHAVLVLLGVTIITFTLENLVATGPQLARAIIGVRATPGQIQAFEAQYGLNHPLPVQYLHFIWQLLHGNLGYSYKLNLSVDSLLADDLPTDVLLVGSAIAIAVLIALPVGVAQAVRRNRAVDYVGTGLSFLLYSMPSFWLALLLVDLLAVTWHLVPPSVQAGAGFAQVVAQPSALVLPIATLALVNFALFSRYMRSSAIEQLAEDYIRTARAKGVAERAVLARHLLRNAVSPVVTLVGLSLPTILTAGLVVEYVFNFPGIGLAYYNAAVSSDYPVLLGITVVVGLVTVVGNLLADVGYAVLDPRVRYGRPDR